MSEYQTVGHRVIVCGGRFFADYDAVHNALIQVHALDPNFVLVHGGAKGADSLASTWNCAWCLGSSSEECHPADWDKYRRPKGRNPAGPIRNRAMLDAGVHLVVAFPGGTGTADMVKIAKAAGVPVWQPCTGEDMPDWL